MDDRIRIITCFDFGLTPSCFFLFMENSKFSDYRLIAPILRYFTQNFKLLQFIGFPKFKQQMFSRHSFYYFSTIATLLFVLLKVYFQLLISPVSLFLPSLLRAFVYKSHTYFYPYGAFLSPGFHFNLLLLQEYFALRLEQLTPTYLFTILGSSILLTNLSQIHLFFLLILFE